MNQEERVFPYTLVRSRRKTLAIYITKNAAVEVRAPLKMPQQYIDRFVASKAQWIDVRLQKRSRIREERAAFTLRYGDPVLLCGRRYPLTAREGKLCGFDGDCFFIPAGLRENEMKGAVVQAYKLAAKQIISPKLAAYAQRMDVEPAGFHITGAQTRWGSCSAKKNLNFSWRLVMAQEEVIDYVVVHELAHIMELNHSPRFWSHVERFIPEHKACRKKLKELQEMLASQEWDG